MTAQVLIIGCVLGLVIAIAASQLRESYPRAATFAWVTLCTSAIVLFGWQLLNLLDALDSGLLRVLTRSGSSITIERTDSPLMFWLTFTVMFSTSALFLFAGFATLLEKVFGLRLRFGGSRGA